MHSLLSRSFFPNIIQSSNFSLVSRKWVVNCEFIIYPRKIEIDESLSNPLTADYEHLLRVLSSLPPIFPSTLSLSLLLATLYPN